jgi:hypothetical protein
MIRPVQTGRRAAVNTASALVRGRRVVRNDPDIGLITRERRGPGCRPRSERPESAPRRSLDARRRGPLWPVEPVEANDRTGQQHERKPPSHVAVPPHLQAPEAAQPRQRPLDPPAVATKPRRRLHPAPGDSRSDPTTPQVRTVRAAVVCLVGVDLARPGAPTARRRTDRRDVVEDRLEHDGVVDVGGGDGRGQRQPTTVADQVELAPGLATIDGICAHLVPHAWPARSWCPHWPATSPAGPAHPAGPGPRDARRRTRRPSPTPLGGASMSPASRSRALGRAVAATGWRCEP